MRRMVLSVGLLGLMAASCTVGWGVGFLLGIRNAYHRHFEWERGIVAPLLAANPAFARIEIVEDSSGVCGLAGRVKTEEDLNRLRALIVNTLGKERATYAVTNVSVEGR